MLPLFFSHKLAGKENDPWNTVMQEMRPIGTQTGPLYFSCTLFYFSHTKRFLQTAAPGAPKGGGGMKELRTECEFISSWQACWEKSLAAVYAALTRPLNLLPALPKKEAFVCKPKKHKVTLNFHSNFHSDFVIFAYNFAWSSTKLLLPCRSAGRWISFVHQKHCTTMHSLFTNFHHNNKRTPAGIKTC